MWGILILSFLALCCVFAVIWRLGYFFVICPAVGEGPLSEALDIGGVLKEYKEKFSGNSGRMLIYKILMAVRVAAWVGLGFFIISILLVKPLGVGKEVDSTVMVVFEKIIGIKR